MPFKSKAQRAYLMKHKPNIAREMVASGSANAKLPGHVKPKKAKTKRKRHSPLDAKHKGRLTTRSGGHM